MLDARCHPRVWTEKQITPECGDGGSCDIQSQQLGRDATLSVGQGDDSLHLIVTVLIKGRVGEFPHFTQHGFFWFLPAARLSH
jgi:hypothetical protein